MYTFATHASELSENPRSSRIDGSATPTIVTSRTIIRYPRQTMISASQRFVLVIRPDMSFDSSVVVSAEESEHAPGSRHARSGPSIRPPYGRAADDFRSAGAGGRLLRRRPPG